MSDVTTAIDAQTRETGSASSKGLAARLLGVVFSPRETYTDIARHPRFLAAAITILVIVIGASTAFLLTEVGKDALFDQQMRVMESFGFRITDQMYNAMEGQLTRAPYFGAVSQLIFTPVIWAVIAGILFGVFNVVLGGEASFRQVYAIVVHSGFLVAVQQLFVNPLNYARHSLSSPTTLAAFTPFLDERSFAALLLSGLDLFWIWLIVNLAIGIGVLYKKKTAPIAVTLLGIYVAIVLIVAGVRAALSAA